MTAAEFKYMFYQTIPEEGHVQEVRIRAGRPIFVRINGEEIQMNGYADHRLIRELLELFANHSLYAYEEEIRQGFLTIEGGHRVGLSGKVVLDGTEIRTMKDISGLNIRLAHERKGCAESILPWLYQDERIQNTIFISPPGGGKTTILRDVIRLISDGNSHSPGKNVSVVDERSEIGACLRGIPQCDLGKRTDILDGCPKALGMTMMIRSMGPEVLAVDEIGTRADLEALRNALRSGVRILATVHGDSLEDIQKKPILSEMVEDGIFGRYLILGKFPDPGTLRGVYDGQCRELFSRKYDGK
ncbi:MAG: stage III sporulation protein AA [Lachnospiraceae bacterium]|nr:stage III sporulation protein AA [Lachnospiraceae bacterium]